jgi:hypothetical protein
MMGLSLFYFALSKTMQKQGLCAFYAGRLKSELCAGVGAAGLFSCCAELKALIELVIAAHNSSNSDAINRIVILLVVVRLLKYRFFSTSLDDL